jgi:hypothetical protein
MPPTHQGLGGIYRQAELPLEANNSRAALPCCGLRHQPLLLPVSSRLPLLLT